MKTVSNPNKHIIDAMTNALTEMAEQNARTLAAQIVATIEGARQQQHSLAALFYSRVHAPDELLALSSFPSGVRWLVLLREQVQRSRWTEAEDVEVVELPNGEIVVFGYEE